MTGRLVDDGASFDALLDEQEAAIAFDDGRGDHMRAPDVGVIGHGCWSLSSVEGRRAAAAGGLNAFHDWIVPRASDGVLAAQEAIHLFGDRFEHLAADVIGRAGAQPYRTE